MLTTYLPEQQVGVECATKSDCKCWSLAKTNLGAHSEILTNLGAHSEILTNLGSPLPMPF